jgi:Acetoacetate decarboxylase (ADC)
MSTRRRERWLAGRYANVDGIPFRMPVATTSSPALVAVFGIDGENARLLLPSDELHPLRLGNRGLLVITVVNYQDTAIGRYVEFCIGIVCYRGRRAARLPGGLGIGGGVGMYVYDLPVSTEISVKGGLGIWGMPKRRASLDFQVGEHTVSSQYDLDGRLVARIDIPRPARTSVPLRFSGVSYGDFRGMLTKSSLHMRGRAGVTVGGTGARLLLGDHERARPLKLLDIEERALFTAYLPSASGVLDDHVEMWFRSSSEPVGPPAVGLRDVVDLGLGQDWPAPPDRARSDRLVAELGPSAPDGRW